MKSLTIEKIRHKFLFVSSTAGVGQTTVTTNLAVGLSQQGAHVGLLDMDIAGPGIHRRLGFDGPIETDREGQFIPWIYSENLKVASVQPETQSTNETYNCRTPLNKAAVRSSIHNPNWGELDYLLVNTPPGTSIELSNLNKEILSAKTVIVSAPNKISGEHAKNMIDFFRKERIQILGWIENMRGFWCQDCSRPKELFSTGSGNRAVFLSDLPFLGRIPIDPLIVQCTDSGKSYLEKYPNSEAATAYQMIAEKMMGI